MSDGRMIVGMFARERVLPVAEHQPLRSLASVL
jgi:hypothetical protein